MRSPCPFLRDLSSLVEVIRVPTTLLATWIVFAEFFGRV